MTAAEECPAGQSAAVAPGRRCGAGEFGVVLRGHRRAAGFTQEELAERSGISVRMIADAESGRTARPHRRSVQLIARALGLAGPEWTAFCAAGRGRAVDSERKLARDPGPGGLGGDGQARRGVPRQLPAAVAKFTGRAVELAALTRMLDQAGAGGPGTVVICAIGGTAGVGKTALALRWAHQVAARFPDGQLHVNLHGFDPSGTPAIPGTAIRGFLDALGVPPGQIPPTPQAQAALYRSLLADKRMLIMLDNARDEQQVRPLLPASPSSLVLVTSRSQLAGLGAAQGAQLLTLDLLSHAEAVHMLTTRLGTARVAAEPGAVDRIASLCACLPLALAVVAARAAAQPSFPLAVLARELADSAARLDSLDAGDPGSNVRAVFSWSTRQLTSQAARMFGLLGIHPGPDITVPAAASLAGIARPQARRLLRELARAGLVAEHVPGRYAFHDLLRAYATEQALATDGQAGCNAAIGRMLDHYLHTAAGAVDLLISPPVDSLTVAPPRPGVTPEHLNDRQQAWAWLQAELQVLLAVIGVADATGFDVHAWQIPWTMASFLLRQGHWHEWAAIQKTAVAAATRLDDTAGRAVSLRWLAQACATLGDQDQALDHYAASLELYQQLGDRAGEAKVHRLLGVAASSLGRYADGLNHAEQALRLYQAVGDRAQQAFMLNNVGYLHALLGDYLHARVFCQQSLTLSAQLSMRDWEAPAWDSLGYAEHHLGNFAEAAACYQRALATLREFGDRYHETVILIHLGDTHHAAGKPGQAREAWLQALDILDDLHHPDADQVRAKLASTPNNQQSSSRVP